MPLAESLAAPCPDARGHRPELSANNFACHQSNFGGEFAGAGWLAQVGHRHRRVHLAVLRGELDPAARSPGEDWPELQVLQKLRATASGTDEW